MRKVALGVALILALAGAGVYALLSPAMLEWRLERSCPQITADCAVRARALAHVWGYKGEIERALHWYRKGAEAGDPMSMFHLAWMIEQKALDEIEALSPEATAGGSLQNPTPELRKQLDEAGAWYRKSADKGFAPAMNNLAQVLARGAPGARNPQAAAHYYRLAAQAGNPVAGFNLALVHLFGDGVTQSASEAEKWLEWSPQRKYNQADLQAPTLERTRIHGGMLAEPMRKKLRDVATAGPPATAKLELRPLKPMANLPTFEQVRREADSRARRRDR